MGDRFARTEFLPERGLVRVHGSSRAASAGEGWLQFYHPEDRDRLAREWREALRPEGRHYYDLTVRIRRRDGVYKRFRVTGAPIKDDVGRVLRWIGTCTPAAPPA